MTFTYSVTDRRLDRDGLEMTKEWTLFNGDRDFGIIEWNRNWDLDEGFKLSLYSPAGKESGVIITQSFESIGDALYCARDNMDYTQA